MLLPRHMTVFAAAILLSATAGTLYAPAQTAAPSPEPPAAGAGGIGAVAPPATAAPSIATPASSTVPPPAAAPALSTEAGPGPLQEKRRALFTRIQAAKAQGIGISSYMGEFTRIEGLVKAGQPESAYADRIDSISKALDDQLKRSQLLKAQRASMPPIVQSGPSTPVPAAGDSTLEQLQKSIGSKGGGFDRVPQGLLDKIPPNMRDRILNSPGAKKLIDSYMKQ